MIRYVAPKCLLTYGAGTTRFECASADNGFSLTHFDQSLEENRVAYCDRLLRVVQLHR